MQNEKFLAWNGVTMPALPGLQWAVGVVVKLDFPILVSPRGDLVVLAGYPR